MTPLDTADLHGSGPNEMLLALAPKGRRGRADIQGKFGALRDPAAGFLGADWRPAAIENARALTLRRLRIDHEHLYQPAVEPNACGSATGWGRWRRASRGALGGRRGAIRAAHAIHPVTPVQQDWSLMCRSTERGVLPACRALALDLGPSGLAAIETAVPSDAVAGERDDARAMATLDSERAG